jgi:hypothetical protein
MLLLLDSYGVEALANATYNRDFVAVRQRSLYNGSLYAYKRLPEQSDMGYYGSKGRLWDYVAVVFGQVQGTFTDVVSPRRLDPVQPLSVMQNNGRVYVRLGCPDQPSCAVAQLYQRQHSALKAILAADQENLVCSKLWLTTNLTV